MNTVKASKCYDYEIVSDYDLSDKENHHIRDSKVEFLSDALSSTTTMTSLWKSPMRIFPNKKRVHEVSLPMNSLYISFLVGFYPSNLNRTGSV